MARTPKDKTTWEMYSKKQQAILSSTLPPEMIKQLQMQYVPAKQARAMEGKTGNQAYDMAATSNFNQLNADDLRNRIASLSQKTNRTRDQELELNALKGVQQFRIAEGGKLARSDSKAQELQSQIQSLQQQQYSLSNNIGAGFNFNNSKQYYETKAKIAELTKKQQELAAQKQSTISAAQQDYDKFRAANGDISSVQAYAKSTGLPNVGSPNVMADGSLQYPGQQDAYVRARAKDFEMQQNLQNIKKQQEQFDPYKAQIDAQNKWLAEVQGKGGLLTPEQWAAYQAKSSPIEAQIAAAQEQYQQYLTTLGANSQAAGYGTQGFLDAQRGVRTPTANVAQPGPTFQPFNFNQVLKNYMAGNINQPLPDGQVNAQGSASQARRPLFGSQNLGAAPFGSSIANNANRINFITTPPPNNQGV